MKTFVVAIALALALVVARPVWSQGPLTPPGPPAPTMKTLDQTEPRIPISSLPVTISESGSYYFTRNLHFTAASGAAITVNASRVTIDLMGFTLSSSPEVTGNGISVSGNGCTVKNGSIIGTTKVVITTPSGGKTWTVTPGGFADGISANGNGHRFADLTISGCRDTGLDGGLFEHNSVLTRCIAHENGGTGLTGGVISESSAYENGGNGIVVGQNLGGTVTACRSYDNEGRGIFAHLVSHSMAQSNGDVGINAIKVQDSTASFNLGNGIESSSGVTNCSARGNSGDGIRGLFIKDNVSSSNAGAGIRFSADGARIEGNNCYENKWGIQSAAGTNSFIVRNSCRGNDGNGDPATNPGASTNYDFDRATNTYGPVIFVNGNMNVNADASHPAANIQY